MNPIDAQLFHACAKSNEAAVLSALVSGADIESRDQEGRTPLMLAAALDRPAAVSALLQMGADPVARVEAIGCNALILASAYGAKSCVDILLAHTDPNIADNQGYTPLMAAVGNGHLQCAKVLLEIADPLAVDLDGRDALCIAASSGHAACVALLKPLTGQRTYLEGCTPLMHAAASGDLPTIEELLDFSPISAKDSQGHSAPYVARAYGHEHAAQFIEAYAIALSELSSIAKTIHHGQQAKQAPRRRKPN